MNKAYISAEWLKPMEEAFVKGRKSRTLPFFDVGVGIDDLQELLRRYVQPLCRYQDHVGNSGKTSCLAFDAINLFVGDGVDASILGSNQMLVLGDSGTGKTSLLLLLKLVNDLEMRSGEYTCEYLQIGTNTLERIKAYPDPANTILLLDGMDEGLATAESARERCLELLEATRGFRRTVLSCENRFFFQNICDREEGYGNGRIGGFDCPMMVLFDSDEYSLIEAAAIQWLIKASEASEISGESGFTIELLYDLVMRMALAMAERDIQGLSEEGGEALFAEYGWYSGNSGNKTRQVGLKRPNPWGFLDMHCNVWEWCFDRDKRFSLRVLSDLKGKEKQEIRAVRGGSLSSLVYTCRTANRNWYSQHEISSINGFRVALIPRAK